MGRRGGRRRRGAGWCGRLVVHQGRDPQGHHGLQLGLRGHRRPLRVSVPFHKQIPHLYLKEGEGGGRVRLVAQTSLSGLLSQKKEYLATQSKLWDILVFKFVYIYIYIFLIFVYIHIYICSFVYIYPYISYFFIFVYIHIYICLDFYLYFIFLFIFVYIRIYILYLFKFVYISINTLYLLIFIFVYILYMFLY